MLEVAIATSNKVLVLCTKTWAPRPFGGGLPNPGCRTAALCATLHHHAALAEEVFARIRERIPEEFSAEGCNERWRFSEYEGGGEFKIHRDGRNQDRAWRKSVITVNIFLNEEFRGGSTDFYMDDKETLRESVKAKRGRAAVFDAQQYHVGARVEEGRKYLLRTDVMAEFGAG